MTLPAFELTGAEAGAISLIDHEHGELVLSVYEGYGHELSGHDTFFERRHLSWNVGIAGKAARSGRAVLLHAAPKDPNFQPSDAEIKAELAIPIMYENQVLAVLVLDSPRSVAFGEPEVKRIQALSASAIQPLRRALRYQELLEESAQLSQIFHNLPNGLALINNQGRVLRHNVHWPQIWGTLPIDSKDHFYIPWGMVSLLLSRLVEPLDFANFFTDRQSNPHDLMTTRVMLREPYQVLQIFSVPTQDTNDQITGCLLIVSDVTRETEADKMLSDS
jgi:putative methionine-R-sulfoxide reductase with GAF domain